MSHRKTDQTQVVMAFPSLDEQEGGPVFVGLKVMAEVQKLMKAKRRSREQLADYISNRRSRTVHKTTVDMWFCETKDKWPSFPDLLLICRFLQSHEPLNKLAAEVGAAVIDHEGMTLLKVGKTYLEKRRLEITQDKLDEAVQSILCNEIRGQKQ